MNVGFIPGTLPIAPDAAEECFACDGVTLAVHTAKGPDGMTHYSLRFWPSGDTRQNRRKARLIADTIEKALKKQQDSNEASQAIGAPGAPQPER